MTTETENEITTINGIPLPSRRTRRRFVIATLVFCWSVAVYVIGWGNPTNSLHVSALAWAFGTSAATIFAYVFGAVMDNWNVSKSIANKQ